MNNFFWLKIKHGMESSSYSDQEINANMYFMAQIEKVLSDSEASSSSADEKISEECENFLENLIESQIDHNESVVDHNDSEGVDKLIRKFNHKIVKCQKRIEKANQQSKYFENQNKDLQDKYDVLKNQATTFEGLEVAFRKSTCFVRNEDGIDLLTSDHSSNLYTIAFNEVASNSSICLLAKASSLQSWLWHQRLSHLNFTTINNLVRNNLVQGLPKMKFEKDHLSACEQGKIHRKHHKSKMAFASNNLLYLLHIDLCGLMHVKKKYAKLEAERYEYMIRYSAYFDNDKQHRKQIADQEVLYDKMSVELVELDKHVSDLKNTILEKDFKISELEECVRNKDLEIEKCFEHLNDCENKLHKMGPTNQTIHMIMPSKDKIVSLEKSNKNVNGLRKLTSYQ
nr:integrase, catalytic region, zinc finger, CCHC-type, peptidase aspartic, catalytic [Tanacetum cinerariifolium]